MSTRRYPHARGDRRQTKNEWTSDGSLFQWRYFTIDQRVSSLSVRSIDHDSSIGTDHNVDHNEVRLCCESHHHLQLKSSENGIKGDSKSILLWTLLIVSGKYQKIGLLLVNNLHTAIYISESVDKNVTWKKIVNSICVLVLSSEISWTTNIQFELLTFIEWWDDYLKQLHISLCLFRTIQLVSECRVNAVPLSGILHITNCLFMDYTDEFCKYYNESVFDILTCSWVGFVTFSTGIGVPRTVLRGELRKDHIHCFYCLYFVTGKAWIWKWVILFRRK